MGNKATIPASSRDSSSAVQHTSLAGNTTTTSGRSSPLLGRISIVDHTRNVSDCYERVDHLVDGSTCSIWSVRKKPAVSRLSSLVSEATTENTLNSSKTTATTTNTSSQLYAMKVIRKRSVDDIFWKEMKNEIQIMRVLDHPNIARVYDAFETQDEMCLVMELCSGGDLWSRAPYHSEAQVAKVLTKILSAVAYLHQNRVVHRDIKVENILYENEQPDAEPKLIDFGISKRHISPKHFKMHCHVGTVACMSPEVIRGDYTSKADLWSVGVVAYQLLSGRQPFCGATDKETIQHILEGEYTMDGQEWELISKEAKEFCSSLLQYDPVKRKSAPQALNNQWLKRLYPLEERTPDNKVMNLVHNALIHSYKNSRFKKLVNMMIAYKMDETALQQLRSAFDALDTNNQGTINYWEFRTALKRCNYTDVQLKEIFKGIDVNETGVINFTEFLAATLEAQGEVEMEQIEQAFNQLDQDNSGFISKENLCAVFGATCSAENCDAIVNRVLEEVDTDEDGTYLFMFERH